MKTSISFLLAFFFAGCLLAQPLSPELQQAMGQALGQLGSARNADDLQAASHSFQRISNAADDNYLPGYYGALALVHRSFALTDANQRDASLNEADKLIASLRQAHPQNDEVEVLYGYALMARMVIDPQTRGQQYSPQVMQSFGKAMSMNPQNPRAAAMMARMELGTSQFFGSPKDKACGLAHHALELYASEKDRGFEPAWGREQAQEVVTACQ